MKSPSRSSFPSEALSQCFGYPRVLGIPVPKTVVFWISPLGKPKRQKIELNGRMRQVTWPLSIICREQKIIACRRQKIVIQS